MFPTLFSFGPIAISTLGVLSFWAFLSATFLFWRKGKEEGFEEDKLLDWVFLGALAGIIIGRLGYILDHWPRFGFDFNLWFDFQKHGGFSFVSAALGAILVLGYLARKAKWDFWVMIDLAVFAVIWAQIWVRLGQFFAGDFVGRQTEFALSLPFPGLEGRYYPIQLFEIGFLLVVFFWLKRLEKHYRLFTWYQDKKGEAQPGFLALVYLLFYSSFRFLLAFFSDSHLYFLGLAFSQWMALVGILIALLGFAWKMGKLEELGQKLERAGERVKPQEQRSILPPAVKSRERRQKTNGSNNRIKTGSDAK